MKLRIRLAILLFTALGGTQPLLPQVTYEQILHASRNPENWVTYSGNYAGWRYSTLDQINGSSIGRLAPSWVFQTGDLGKFETNPVRAVNADHQSTIRVSTPREP